MNVKWADAIRDESGLAIDAVTISVKDPATNALVPIFSDEAGTAKANPFTTGAKGIVSFYVNSTTNPQITIHAAKVGHDFTVWNELFSNVRLCLTGGGTGDVVGPASAVNNNLAAFDGTTGKLIKDSGNLSANVADAVVKRLLLQDVISPYVVSGLTATVTGTDANVTIAPGTAYNIQRLHTTVNTILTVTNTGAAHTEYVSVNTSGALIITTTPRAADELAVADVSVNAAGVAIAVTDVRQRKLHIKVDGVIRETLDELGRRGIGTPAPNATLHTVQGTTAHSVPSGDWAGIIVNTNDISTEHGLLVGNRWKAPATTAFEVGNIWHGNYDSFFLINGIGNVGIRATTVGNILTVQQGSATDPIADAWLTYSLHKEKTILKDARVLDFDRTPVRRWKRKLVKPKLTDFEEIREETEEGVEHVRTREDQLADALEEYAKKKNSQKFNQEQFGLIAEEAPDCLKAYDDTGALVGVNTSAYVGWLHAVVKEQNTTIKDLTTRVQALETGKRLKE